MKKSKQIMAIVFTLMFISISMCFAGSQSDNDGTVISPAGAPNGNMIDTDLDMGGHRIINASDVMVTNAAPLTNNSLGSKAWILAQDNAVKNYIDVQDNQIYDESRNYTDIKTSNIIDQSKSYTDNSVSDAIDQSKSYTDNSVNNINTAPEPAGFIETTTGGENSKTINIAYY